MSETPLPPDSSGAQGHPLELTVHSLPSLAPGAQARQRVLPGRIKMLVIMLLCFAPVAMSYFTYYVLRPQTQRSFGTLIEPQRAIPMTTAADPQGKAVPLRDLTGQWLMVVVGHGSCTESCQHNLFLARQMRLSLGAEKDRVDWVWLVDDSTPIPAGMQPGLQGATVLRVPNDVLTQWLPVEPGHAMGEYLYMVDPLGHLMMRFPPNLDLTGAAKAKSDIERLLRASASWDVAGRSPTAP